MIFSVGQSQTPAAGPASPPARNTWDVLSQYGSAYSNQPGVYFDSFGGANIVGDVTLADLSVVKKYIAHSYSGIAPNGANNLNVSGMTHLHMDVWSPDFVSFKVKLEGTNGSNVELEVPFAKNQGSWNSYDLDLSTYSGVTLTNLKWIVPVTFGPNNTTLYITNVYFYRPATTQPPTLGTFTVPSQLVGAPNVIITPPTTNSSGAFSYTSSNPSVATIVNGNEIQINDGGTSTITANQAAATPYGAGSTITTFTASYPAPGPSPVPPPRSAGTVVSMFTGTPSTYANVVNAIRAPWTAGTTLTTIPNGSDTCLQLDNFGYLGYITPGANFSAIGMTKLHVDVYLNTPLANMFIVLLAPGDQMYNTGPLTVGWNSLDINLSNYPGANLADIYGIKFEHNQPGLRQIYLDNIYFYVAGSDPTITDFTVPTKVFGDADFNITPPTSNSAGAFTYQSSNTSVATIVNGNQIHIMGIGTSTITANQAAAGVYDAGSITTSFVVSAPPLTTPAPNPPARNPWDVVSLYSDAYTNIPSAVWVGASTLTDELLGGNPTKKMSNFIVEFINSAPINVSEMTMLHMDIYALDVTAFNIWLLNNGDRRAQISTPINGWRSIDIPMSTYSSQGLNLTGLIQLKFEGLSGPGTTAYVDNVYYYRPATLPPATVGAFSVPAKNVGDANFTITPPTSNNSSPFTYSSTNTSVATIVGGNQIHIVTGGTTTITASQVSDGTYGPTSKTATFVVNFPAPGPSPIPPARAASRVMSMYTGTPSVYANNPLYTTVRAFWTAGTTMTEIPNGTNTALKVDNLGYIGLIDQSERRLNVSAMTNLHLDVYVNAPFANLFFWILTDGDQRRDIVNLTAGWNSINIPLSEFAGANLSNVYGLKFEQNTPNPLQMYLDNIYFSDDTYYTDADGDGYGNLASPVVGQPAGSVLDATDCDDTRASVRPGAVDVCYDGLDNDCNGNVDNVGLPGGCTPKIANLQSASCGATVSALNTIVSASNVPGAQAFRFKITNMTTMAVQTLDSPTISFQFMNLPGVTFGTQYKVEVAIKFAGVWQGFYGAPCFVNTPSPVSVVSSAQCGSTLTSMSQYINSSFVSNVTGYRYEVTNQTNGQTQYVFSSINRFTLTQLLASNQTFATNYFVRVACRNTDGTYLPEGPGCIVKSPAFPTTQVVSSLCNNYLVPSMVAPVTVDPVPGATLYKFRLFNGTYDFVVESIYNRFTLSMFPGLEQGTLYSVQAAAQVGGIFDTNVLGEQKWGKTCTLTTPNAARQTETAASTPRLEVVVNNEFNALAYPNPFAANFKLDVTTNSEENLSVRVYDMLGKLVEDRQVNASDVETLEVGANYTSGVYNVIVTQGENIKTLRVIKR